MLRPIFLLISLRLPRISPKFIWALPNSFLIGFVELPALKPGLIYFINHVNELNWASWRIRTSVNWLQNNYSNHWNKEAKIKEVDWLSYQLTGVCVDKLKLEAKPADSNIGNIQSIFSNFSFILKSNTSTLPHSSKNSKRADN